MSVFFGLSLKAKDDYSFWSSAKRRKVFSKITDNVKYYLKMWIIYHLHVIQYPIENYYIAVNFDYGISGVKTELSKKLLLQVSFCGLHVDLIKIYATGFSMVYNEKGLVNISDSDIIFILPPQLQNMTQHHQIICD